MNLALRLLGTLLTGAILGGVLLLFGAPWWAAVGFGVTLAELRQSRILAEEPARRRSAEVDRVRRALQALP